MLPRNLLVFLLLFSFKFPSLASAENTTFDFQYFTVRDLTLLGDSHLKNGIVGLTRELGVPSSSSGSLIYNNPIHFFDQESNTTASFATKFSFSINNVNPSSFGDGLTFFLSPDNQTLGSPGGYLGLVNSSQSTKNKFLAIEFDTKLDAQFNDPNQNHVGLDINKLNSIKTADAMLQDIDLKSGNLITAWIDYKNDLRALNVFLSYSTLKPLTPLLSVDIDLSGYLKEDMFVGFSASTEGSTEVHSIVNWKFKTFGFLPVRPRSHPHNVSDSSVTIISDVPVSNSTNKHHKRLGLGLGIAGPAFFFVVLAVFGYVSVKKWKDMRTENQKMVNLVDWVWKLHGEGRITAAADKRLNGDFKEEEMRKLLLVGLSCAHPDSAQRPSIRRVLQILNNEVEPMAVPRMKPSLSFSCSLTVEDIVSDDEESKTTA
ncbi:hypothetical protein QUC31_001607 [Theobroma cacao]